MFQSNLSPPSKSGKFKGVEYLDLKTEKTSSFWMLVSTIKPLFYVTVFAFTWFYVLPLQFQPYPLNNNVQLQQDFTSFQLHILLKFTLPFLSPDDKNLLYFTIHSFTFSKFLLMPSDIAKCQVNVPNRSIHVLLWLLSKNDIQQSVQVLTKYTYSSQDWLCLLLSLANNCSPSPLLSWLSPNRYQVKSTIIE